MKITMITGVVVVSLFLTMTKQIFAQDPNLSIYEIQYTTDVNGASPQDGNMVNCCGIVVFKGPSWKKPKLALYDPNYPYGWGGIAVKDINSVGAFDDVNVGDWVSFTNVLVEEFKGTTFLQYKEEIDSNLVPLSRNNPLPKPLVVSVNEITAPVPGGWNDFEFTEWLVADHNSEKYEGMLIKVIDVNVQDIGYGKGFDNYILESNIDPNLTCWASDYLNIDKGVGPIYHPYVINGQRFCGVSGVLEQYTSEKEGIYYDYYQLLTTSTESFIVEQTADFDDDCDVDFVDFALFAGHWLQSGCAEPDWCGGADLTREQPSGVVDLSDLLIFVQNWLEGK